MQTLLGRVCCLAPGIVARSTLQRVQPWFFNPANIQTSTHAARQRSSRGSSPRAAAVAGQQQQPQQQAPAPRPLLSAEDAFYAEAAHSFEELGIMPVVAESLKAAGFAKPSRVQELALPHIISGKDVVLAAETGSGKTLAYIAPLASALMQRTSPAAAAPAAGSKQPTKQLALVLCPNVALCQQVIRLVHCLASSTGQPLLKACQVSSSNPPPFEPPDVVVTTPGALVTLFNDRGYNYGSQWTAEGLSARAAFVVVDEADLLSQGGYVKDLTRLLDALKAGERRVIEAQVMQELAMSGDEFSRLPRHIKQACWESGTPGMIQAGFRISNRQPEQQQQQQQQGEELVAGGEGGAAASSGNSSSSECSSSSSSSSSGSSSSYGPYFKRQYLFVAATLPALTKADVGTELQKRFKGAVWVSGDMLHHIKPHVDHQWLRVREGGADEALIAAVQQDPDYQAQQARVLVFARDTANADRLSDVLQQHGIPNVRYHKNVARDERDAALATMSAAHAAGGNVIMVSTDAAARGIDLPDITHVIQADFAMTAIEFLHRVGRTARAGKAGKVTSLYGKPHAVLAEALRQYIDEGRPIEDCFSRNRSFSKKVKRYGKFVPRGQEGPQRE